MYASYLIKRIFIYCPCIGIAKIPLRLKSIWKNDVKLSLIILANPVITVTGNHSGLIRNNILFSQSLTHLHRTIKNPDVIIQIHLRISCITNPQNIIEESKISITSITSELRNEVDITTRNQTTSFHLRTFLYQFHTSHVRSRYNLVFINEEYRNP